MTAHGRRRGGGLAAAAMLMTLVATGCAQSAPLGPEAEGHETVDCRSEPSALSPNPDGRLDDSSVAVPGRVPDGFEAVAALRCSLELTLAPAPDREPVPLEFWSESGPPPNVETPENAAGGEVVWRVERLEGDLTRLLNALAAPDDLPSAGLACTADMEIVPALWLESRSGEFVPVHYPRNGCGKTKPAVRDALAGLQVTIVVAPLTSE
ncbi:hypothetical protein [Cryobacterium sp. BB307]|uniref:hypothetical protein n=1 Tax=Cryobacterium sp. BB307 TaxID=2716317 RepID=UPI001444F623|nr:hypothetical protein [Cryobacterium sp. BB307]